MLLADKPAEAENWYKETKAIFSNAQMHISVFFCNEFCIREKIPAKDRVSSKIVSVLGLLWDTERDFCCLKRKDGLTSQSPKELSYSS